MEYAFTNWTQVPFEGRYGGVNYPFAPGESRVFDPDKHQMLIIMAKQLADRELLKGIAGVGKNPNDTEKFGKALDAEGNLFDLKVGDRKDYMRRAIGILVDTPLPIPADQMPDEEAGATAGATADISELKDQVEHLTELVQSLAAAKGGEPVPVEVPREEYPTPQPAAVVPPAPPVAPVAPPQGTGTQADRGAVVNLAREPAPVSTPPAASTAAPNMGMTRELLIEMCHDVGLSPNPHSTKEQLVELLSPSRPSVA
jgi:hypothetical protein